MGDTNLHLGDIKIKNADTGQETAAAEQRLRGEAFSRHHAAAPGGDRGPQGSLQRLAEDEG